MKNNLAVLVAIFVASTVSVAEATTVTVPIDLSHSNPIVHNDQYAAAAARYIATRVRTLSLGDYVKLRTFGERGLANLKALTVQISRQNRADKVAEVIEQSIRAIPTRSKSEGQQSTNIIAFLEFNDFQCAQGGEVILISDGIEMSDYVNGEALLKGKVSLPEPEANLLSGCTITMFGLGQSTDGPWPPQQIKNLRSAWTTWMKKAGAKFTAIVDPTL